MPKTLQGIYRRTYSSKRGLGLLRTVTVRISLTDVDYKLLMTFMITRGIKYTKGAVQTIVEDYLHKYNTEQTA